MVQERTPKNAAGPFYVVKDECITCRAPESEASELMGFNEGAHSCFFRRQPATADEVYHAIRALRVSCCGAHRYDGSDREVAQRLVDLGLADQVDGNHDLRPRGPRDRVTFAFGDPKATPTAVLTELGRRMVAMRPTHSVTELSIRAGIASLVFGNQALNRRGHRLHGLLLDPCVRGIELMLRLSDQGGGRWVLVLYPAHSPVLVSMATFVDDIFRADGRVSEIRWYTEADWAAGRVTWNSLPV